MSKLTWKLQEKFVERLLRGDVLWWDSMADHVAFGDVYHYYILKAEDVFVDFEKLENSESTYKFSKTNVLQSYYHKLDFCSNVCWTVEQRARDKGTLRKFEYLDKHLWINEAYLKEFDFLKYPESVCIGADPVNGFKMPVRFESGELVAVILPVRVGDENV